MRSLHAVKASVRHSLTSDTEPAGTHRQTERRTDRGILHSIHIIIQTERKGASVNSRLDTVLHQNRAWRCTQSDRQTDGRTERQRDRLLTASTHRQTERLRRHVLESKDRQTDGQTPHSIKIITQTERKTGGERKHHVGHSLTSDTEPAGTHT